jgi:hypothetical protein
MIIHACLGKQGMVRETCYIKLVDKIRSSYGRLAKKLKAEKCKIVSETVKRKIDPSYFKL